MEGTDFVRLKIYGMIEIEIKNITISLNLHRRRSDGEADSIKIKRKSIPDDEVPIPLKDKVRICAADDEEDDYTKDEHENDDEEDDEIKHKDEDDQESNEENEYEDEGDEDSERNASAEKGKIHHVTHGYYMVEGNMKHGMEDYLVAKKRKMNDHDLGLYAIFDGHSGREVAEYMQDHLFDNILSQPDFWTNPVSAVKRAYRSTDDDILDNVVGSRGGSTAVTAILVDKTKLVVANVGDSRAVQSRNGKAKQLTVDHDPRKEKKLVEGRGGFVSQLPGNVPRVDGQLAMTRAFGDGRLKDHITADPDVLIENIEEDTEFIIFASDGLWKVMSNQEASDCIRGLKDGREAAKVFINEALQRGSQDDIS